MWSEQCLELSFPVVEFLCYSNQEAGLERPFEGKEGVDFLFLILFFKSLYMAVLGLRCAPQHRLFAALCRLGCSVAFGDLSSPISDQTHIPCIARQILNHWTSREVPLIFCFYTKF